MTPISERLTIVQGVKSLAQKLNGKKDTIGKSISRKTDCTHKRRAATAAQFWMSSLKAARQLECSRRVGITNCSSTSSSCTSRIGLSALGGERGGVRGEGRGGAVTLTKRGCRGGSVETAALSAC